MAYLVFKGSGFWRKRGSLRLREVSYFRFLFWKFKNVKETYVKKKKVLVVQGGMGSGKTRELKKIERFSRDLYSRDAVYIPVGEGITNWYKRAGISKDELRGLSQFEKNEKLIEACKGKVVILDDIDKATSSVKVEVLKWLIRVSDRVVVSCRDIKLVHPSLEYELRKKLRLKSFQGWDSSIFVDLGKRETEIRDVGLLTGIVLVVFVALSWGITHALLGALAFRWIVAEARLQKYLKS